MRRDESASEVRPARAGRLRGRLRAVLAGARGCRSLVAAAALALCLALSGVTAAPAQAGDGFWSAGCRADVLYYGVPGYGSWYYTTWDQRYHWLGGDYYQTFRANGYECGRLGAPTGGDPLEDVYGNVIGWPSAGHACGRLSCSVVPTNTHIHFQYGCVVVDWYTNRATNVMIPCQA